jgi:6-phosphogluconate dehydrogenase
MGKALALNLAQKGFAVAVFNRTAQVTRDFHESAGDLAAQIIPTETLETLVAALKEPRAILLMIPAGAPVDNQTDDLIPLLDPDDMIIDAGNANFRDTNRRAAETPVRFLGIGVSGGEEGARHGPSIMGGGPREAWDRVAPMLTAIAAEYEGTPCAAWMGDAGAGHFVKTVHNGIEYADMQMISEIYGILRDGLGKEAAEIADIFERWDRGPLKSFLIEISAKVARAEDAASGGPLLDVIADAAGQKGTGRWTVIEAQHLGAATPAIEAAVAARNLSAERKDRARGQETFGKADRLPANTLEEADLENALIAGKILCYAQGFAMMAKASEAFGWALPLPAIAKVWRAGCIIRSEMLDDMATALEDEPDQNLIFAAFFSDRLRKTHGSLREVVALSATHGLAAPALGAALGYFDTMRAARGTANMIQGQRDYFGLHGFERVDTGATGQHGPWARG